jgi:uncharacterized protein involved in exopolysaccharide biosynthesis
MEQQGQGRRKLLSILSREKYLIVSTSTITVPMRSYIHTPQYASMASLLITSGPEFEPQLEAGKQVAPSPYLTIQDIIKSEIARLTCNDLLMSVIYQIRLARPYPKFASDPPSDMRPIDAAVLSFGKDLKIEAAKLSEVINLTYDDPDRNIKIAALSALIRSYEVRHAEAFGEKKASFYAHKLADYNRMVDSVTHKITALRQKKSLFDVTVQQNRLIQYRSQLISMIQALESKSVDTHGRINYTDERLRHLTAPVLAGQRQSDAIDNAKGKLLDLQTQMLSLGQRFDFDPKLVRDIPQQISAVQDFFQGRAVTHKETWLQRDPAYEDANLKMQQGHADASSIDAQIVLEQQHLQKLNAQLGDVVESAHGLEAPQRDHDMLDDTTRTVQTRYEEAKASEDLGRQKVGSEKFVLQSDASMKPAKPKHLVFALVGWLIWGGCFPGLFHGIPGNDHHC